jgi:small-conductance mechanosensitive channel
MTDEKNGADTSAPAAEPQNTGYEHMIPKARFDEVNNARKDLEARLAKLEKDQQTAREQQLAEQQKWQELAEERAKKLEELSPYKAQFEAVSTTLESTLAAQLEDLPDDVRDMVDSMPGDVQQKLDWLSKNRGKLLRPTAPNTDAGVRGDTKVQKMRLTPDQEAALARAQGVDPSMTRERYIAALLKMQGGE